MQPSRRSYLWLSLGLGFLALSSSILAYYRIFTGFTEWDDEGTQMMPIRQFLSGGTLYENVRTGYGPVYYFFNWVVRTLTGTPVTNDVTRFTSMVIWTVCAMACAWIVWRFSKSLVAALVTHFLVFRLLGFFCNEPGHPQELCMLLVVALIASGFAAESPRLRFIAMLAAGALPAALLWIKVNIGAFATLAVALALLCHVPQILIVRVARYLAAAAAIMLPILLIRAHLTDPLEIAYWMVIACGAAAFLVLPAPSAPLLTARDCILAITAFVAVSAVTVGTLYLQGVGLNTLLTSLVLNHLRMSVLLGNWYLPMKLNIAWVLWALAGPASAFYFTRRKRSVPAIWIAVPAALALLLAALGTPQLVGIATPFCWVIAVARPTYPRTLLAAVATLQTLYAYPIAGSQTSFVCVPLILVAGVALADALAALPPGALSPLRDGALAPRAAMAVAACILLSYPAQVWRARAVYHSQAPLNLPGAERIHIEPDVAAIFQWLARDLKQNCDTFVAYPGIPSLNFWTGLPMPGPVKTPPGPLNSGQWTDLFSAAQQQAIVDEFSRHPNACVVYHPSGVYFWNKAGVDHSSLPLVHYIGSNFHTVETRGDYQFQLRNDRASIPR